MSPKVSEVLSTSKCRLSVSGWFHGKPIVRPPPHIEAAKDVVKPGDFDVISFLHHFKLINNVFINL